MPAIDDAARRRELGEFLRSRRQRLTPAEAGLALGRRRRTPGLRREDVAELAGLGTAWYTWLEQARDISPSPEALRRIARALRLDATEERYFLELALECTPVEFGVSETRDEIVPHHLEHLIEAIKGPAYIKGGRWDLLTFNRVGDAVFDYGNIADPNVLRNLFSPQSRARLADWETCARQHVAMFRTDCASMLKDPWVHALVDKMIATSDEFRTWWAAQLVEEIKTGPYEYDHPRAGRLSLSFTILQSADASNLRLVAFLPNDDDTRERIDALVAERRRKRARD